MRKELDNVGQEASFTDKYSDNVIRLVEKYICIHNLLLINFFGKGREGRGRGFDLKRRKQARNQLSAV